MPNNIFLKKDNLYRNNKLYPNELLYWSNTTTYNINDTVSFENEIYYSLIDNNLNNNPLTYKNKWKKVTSENKNHVLKSYDITKGKILPINYTLSGTDFNLNSPGQYDATMLTPIYDGFGTSIYIGDYSWTSSDPVGTYYRYFAGGSTYGIVKFGIYADNWTSVNSNINMGVDVTNGGLVKLYFPKNAIDDNLGGYIEYYFHNVAWTYAFITNGTTEDVVIAQNGSVYKSSITQANLVVRWDGVVGLAGGGSSINDINREGIINGVVDNIIVNHDENTKELFAFSRTNLDNIGYTEITILNQSQISVTTDSQISPLRTNILPITENILYDYSTVTGLNTVNHNFNLEDYFVVSKSNIASTLSVRAVKSQTENSCVISAITGTASENYYFINKDSFDKYITLDTSTEGSWIGSTLVANHNINSSDYFVWAVDRSSNLRTVIPTVTKAGLRKAHLGFNNSSSSNLTVYFGGTSDNQVWYTGSNLQATNVLLTDTNENDWGLYVNASGILNTIQRNA